MTNRLISKDKVRANVSPVQPYRDEAIVIYVCLVIMCWYSTGLLSQQRDVLNSCIIKCRVLKDKLTVSL